MRQFELATDASFKDISVRHSADLFEMQVDGMSESDE